MQTADCIHREGVTSSVDVEVVGSGFEKEWNRFVAGADHHFFHYFEWSRILREAYGFEPYYLAARDGECLLAVCPLFLTRSMLFGRCLKSHPFHVEGGVAFAPEVTDKEGIYRTVLDKIFELQSSLNATTVDLKFRDPSLFNSLPENQVRIYQHYYRYVVDVTPGEEPLFASFRQDVRNSTRRARKFGVDAVVGTERGDIEIFKELYVSWSRNIGLPGHPGKFFDLLWDEFFPRGMARIVLAKLNGQHVGAKLFLVDSSNGSVLQNWGVMKDFNLNRFQVNTAMHWEEIRWCANQGYREFDFGVTSQHHKGSRYFKSGWNTEEIPVYFCNIGDFSKTKHRDDHNAGQLFRKVWKRMPRAFVRQVGPHILKQGN